ncbi:sugar transferase [Clostridium grantii]|uniref:Sugar transferase involved in LPS biosynthesis (Colanic, teichoic acid) n=1 Tax=Clostridium grantii DSM 8605 TaxID=1121316 RepID=A0A1M5SLX1_9CLOT|nr:sugar transferase [Clostridium grantii]SHH39420.1 Sugar transferase involved in LPS biosynthesis (colanic, teichoic acid) [Clostridium grantii DSM 8605]
MEINKEINSNFVVSKEIQLMIKRCIDVGISIVGILILLPFFIVIPILIRMDSKGNVIFKQTRVGKNGEYFTILKFRTMVNNADSLRKIDIPSNIGDYVIQDRNDSRVTKLGAFLRKTSLDEIPQLFNVFMGSMSIVGPRPEVPDIEKHFPQKYKQRVLMTPGITGWAQINGRGEIPLEKKISYDLEYIQNYSLFLDIKIILKTFSYVFQQQGAM